MIRRFIDIVFLCAILAVVGFAIANREKYATMVKSSSTKEVVEEREEEVFEETLDDTQSADNKQQEPAQTE